MNPNFIPLFYKSDHDEWQMTRRDFEKITGAEWIEDNQTHENSPFLFPIKKKGIEPKWLLKEYENFLKRPIEAFTLGPASAHSAAGLGLFARRQYRPFEVVGEYLGEYTTVQSGNYTLTLDPEIGINAEKYGNGLSRVNDSFPNLFLQIIWHAERFPYRALLVSLEVIEPGEQLSFNYGAHDLKKGPHQELREAAAIEFIKKYEAKDWIKCLEKLNPLLFKSFTMEEIAFVAKFHYLLQTPTTLLSLMFRGEIPYEKGKEFFVLAASEQKHLPKKLFEDLSPLLGLCKKWRSSLPTQSESMALVSLFNQVPLVEAIDLIRAKLA